MSDNPASIQPSAFILQHSAYDALLLLSFGGPERPEDVLPFLENVLRGKRVPRERMLEVAKHYELFDGISPLNMQNRALLAALVAELNAHGPHLPVYWGNRNWHPLLTDTVQQMAEDGVRRALAFVTSAFGSYSGCRQYLENIEEARRAAGPNAPQIDKLRLFYNHPGFIEPMADRVAAALETIPAERREAARLVYAAHSIPLSMAAASPYQAQLCEACRLVSARVGRAAWDLVYQSRSGPPEQPWLEPDVDGFLKRSHETGGVRDVVLVPIGFLSEHMEVIYDLDVEIAGLCESLDINLVRAGVIGTHPRFVTMIRELIQERLDPQAPRLSLGDLGPSPDECPSDCCQAAKP
jgi:protoporphyrin/coproporphyrin ferrochelatase